MTTFTKNITVEVTQEDIDRGCINSAYNCPIARAAQRLFPDFAVSVGQLEIFITDKMISAVTDASYVMSSEAQSFVRRFDNEWTVKPFKFIAYLSFLKK